MYADVLIYPETFHYKLNKICLFILWQKSLVTCDCSSTAAITLRYGGSQYLSFSFSADINERNQVKIFETLVVSLN